MPAQPNAPQSHRFLLVVETSRSMQPRMDGLLKTVQGLLASGLQGQLQPGDTLGLWTFNQELYAGRFPLQYWSKDSGAAIAERMLAFLKQQKYEKHPVLDKVLPQMRRIIQGSELITVVLVSTGEAQSRDTPFDAAINELYQRWGTEQQKARMPFVTVLRAQSGKFTNYAVSPAPWPLDMPPLPERQPQEVAEKTPVPPPPKPSTVPPLILSGKKAEVIALPTSEATRTEPGPVEKLSTEPKPTVSATPAPAPEPRLAPPVAVAAPDQKETSPAVFTTAPVSAASTPQPEPKPIEPPQPTAPPPTPAQASTPVPALAAAPGSASRPAATEPAPVAAPSRAAEPSQVAPETPAVQAAVTAPPARLVNRKALLITGLALAGLACGVLLLLMRRARSSSHVSLITSSIEREKE